MSKSIRSRLRAHVIAPLPVALGLGMLGSATGVAGQAQDDQFEAVQRFPSQMIGNVRDNDNVDPSLTIASWQSEYGFVSITPEGDVHYRASIGSCDSGIDQIEYGYSNLITAVAVVTLLPATQPDYFEVRAGTSIDFDVRANDPLQENLLDVVAFTSPAIGTLTQLEPVANSGLFRFEAPSQSELLSFEYSLREEIGSTCGQPTDTVSLRVLPNALDDSLTTPHATEACIDVLANDLGENALQVVGFTTPSHGSVNEGSTPRELCYTPIVGYRGSDSFQYTVEDSVGNDTSTVLVTVLNAPPVANPDSASTVAGVPATGNVLDNDTDPNGDLLSVTSQTEPANGSVTVAAGGAFTYTATTGFSGDDAFGYTISDGFGGSSTASVNIAVLPSAQPDSFATAHATVVTGNVLANDLGSGLTVISSSDPAQGSASVAADGTVNYTPPAGFRGSDAFEYTVRDASLRESSATVTVTVANAVPIAVDDIASTIANQSVSGNVLANDSDANDDPLTVTDNTEPANGSVVIAADGEFTYTPADGFSGDDAFSYTVSDGFGGSSTATVNIAALPAAQPDTLATAHATVVTGNVLTNDLGSGLTVISSSDPTQGSASVAADGTVNYTPPTGFRGSDEFEYAVRDASLRESSATVTVTVANAVPITVDDIASTIANQPVSGNVLANDSDANDDPLTVTDNTDPANGSVAIGADGAFTYTPAAGFSGDDAFTYTASDGFGGNSTATVDIAVLPSAQPDTLATAHATVVTGNVLANDLGSGLTVISSSDPVQGSASVAADGTVSYTPQAGFRGSDAFEYRMRDASLRESSATVTVTVANAAPIAADDGVSTIANQPVSGNVLANDSDTNGDTLTVTDNTSPARGTLVIAADGAFAYTPASGTSGDDSFEYTISDGQGGTSSATVSIAVNPVATDDVLSVVHAGTLGGNVLANDIGTGLQVVGNEPPDQGSVTFSGDGNFSYVAPAGFSGDDSFEYTIADAAGRQSTAIATIAVASAITLDAAVDGTSRVALIGTPFTQPLAVILTQNGAPLAGQSICFSVQAAGSGASATLSAAEVVTDANGEASITATANTIGGSYNVIASLCNQPQVSMVFSMQNALGPPTQIPTLGHGLLALLAAMLGWVGLRRRREG